MRSGKEGPSRRMNYLQEYQLARERAEKVNAFVNAYSPGEHGILNTLKRIYDNYLLGLQKIEEGDTYYLWQMFADYDCEPYIDYSEDYYVRDEDGFILVEPSIERAKDFLEDEYLRTVQAGFVRTVHKTKLLKEELMMNVWHPQRVEKFLETYGWEAYDNLLGVE